MARSDGETDDLEQKLVRLERKVDAIIQLPMQTLKWVGSLIVGAVITILVQNYMLHQESTQKTQQVAQVAAQTAAQQVVTNRKLEALETNQAAQGAAP